MDQNQMMMDYLLQMGEMRPEEAEIAKKQAMVEQLRGMSQQSPGMRGNGRMQVAANPLEFLNQGLQGYAAKQMGTEADAAQKAYSGKRMGALKDLRSRWMPPAATPGIVPPAGGGSPYGDDPYAVGGW